MMHTCRSLLVVRCCRRVRAARTSRGALNDAFTPFLQLSAEGKELNGKSTSNWKWSDCFPTFVDLDQRPTLDLPSTYTLLPAQQIFVALADINADALAKLPENTFSIPL